MWGVFRVSRVRTIINAAKTPTTMAQIIPTHPSASLASVDSPMCYNNVRMGRKTRGTENV
mgnify:CR=1 FL=1